ncbi:MAG: hypothetical protein Q8R08_00410 [bacterium]|nr:hypothetical protein [bacterium]
MTNRSTAIEISLGIILLALVAVLVMMSGRREPQKQAAPTATKHQKLAQETAKANSVSAIELALRSEKYVADLRMRAARVGVNCWLGMDREKYCEILTSKAEKNPKLAQAFLEAGKKGVSVHGFYAFLVGNGFVDVDATKSDDEILKFLLGKN